MELDVRRLKEMLADGDVQLVDVREPFEHEAAHIPGDRLIPLGAVAGAAADLDRERPLVFYCRSGNRSAMPTEAFRRAGYDAYNLAGGILAWHKEGFEVEPSDGKVVGRD